MEHSELLIVVISIITHYVFAAENLENKSFRQEKYCARVNIAV